MEILPAQRLVEATEESLGKGAGDFDGVQRAAENFVEWAKWKLQETEECELVLQSGLSEKRLRRKEKKSQESSQKMSHLASADADFKVKVAQIIIDSMTEALGGGSLLVLNFGLIFLVWQLETLLM